MKTRKYQPIVLLALIAAIILLAACSGGGDKETGLANPASVFCEEQGGTLEIRDSDEGQIGYCIFPDGSECEEWAYYREECSPGEIFP